jgi:hypothetical protein
MCKILTTTYWHILCEQRQRSEEESIHNTLTTSSSESEH